MERHQGANCLRAAYEMPKDLLKRLNTIQFTASSRIPAHFLYAHGVPDVVWLIFVYKRAQKYSKRMFIELPSDVPDSYRKVPSRGGEEKRMGKQTDEITDWEQRLPTRAYAEPISLNTDRVYIQ